MTVIHSNHHVDVRVGVLQNFDLNLILPRIPFDFVRLNTAEFG